MRIVEAWFEQPDGSSVLLDTDYCDNPHLDKPVPGPIETKKTGVTCFEVWKN